jgi:methionyl-tRNA formyltransferase
MKVVYFGTPAFAVPTLRALIESPHEVVGVVTQPDKRRGRGQKVTDGPVKTLALEHGLPVFQPARLRDADVRPTIAAWQPDLGVVAAYGKIIPDDLLMLPRFGMINVHASILPNYRGAAPVHRAVIDGAAQTGVTIMRVIAQLDAGEMFAKATRPIGPDETSDVVERDLAQIGATLLLRVVDEIAGGTATCEPQDDMLSSYAPRLTKEEGLIDWSLPATYLHNRVRGLYPWPHAYSYLNGERLILLRSRAELGRAELEGDAAVPGTVLDVQRDELVVACGFESTLAITELQPEGRRPMRVRDFLAGHPVAVGARFGAP